MGRLRIGVGPLEAHGSLRAPERGPTWCNQPGSARAERDFVTGHTGKRRHADEHEQLAVRRDLESLDRHGLVLWREERFDRVKAAAREIHRWLMAAGTDQAHVEAGHRGAGRGRQPAAIGDHTNGRSPSW